MIPLLPHILPFRRLVCRAFLRLSGSMPDRKAEPLLNSKAFTLIEIIVVAALISIILFVAIPRLDNRLFSSDANETGRWIIANVRHLKEKAIADQKTYLLNVSPDIQRLWITPLELLESEVETAKNAGYSLPNGVTIDDVVFSQTERFSSGTIPIAFYPQGYSDKAVIHIKTDNGDRLSFFIEPFLPDVHLIKGDQVW